MKDAAAAVLYKYISPKLVCGKKILLPKHGCFNKLSNRSEFPIIFNIRSLSLSKRPESQNE